MRRLTFRWRLTLLFALAYFGVAALLITTAYVAVRARLGGWTTADAEDLLDSRDLPFPTSTGADGSLVIEDDAALAAALEELRSNLVADTLNTLVAWSALAALISGALAIGLGWYTAGRALAPVRSVTATARQLSEANLSERVRYQGPDDELADLAETFDTMLDRIERGFDAQRQFTAMASHELRTPLAQMTAAGGLAKVSPGAITTDELADTVLTSSRRAADLVDRLLDLMRSRAGVRDPASVRLDRVVQRACDELSDLAAQRNIAIELSAATTTVTGDEVLLTSLVENLLRNAVVHNLDGGRVAVTVAASDEGAEVVVENTGVEMSEESVARITEPFRREVANPDQLGHGLGTTIIRTAAEAHGGRSTFSARYGGGLVVRVTLPRVTSR